MFSNSGLQTSFDKHQEEFKSQLNDGLLLDTHFTAPQHTPSHSSILSVATSNPYNLLTPSLSLSPIPQQLVATPSNNTQPSNLQNLTNSSVESLMLYGSVKEFFEAAEKKLHNDSSKKIKAYKENNPQNPLTPEQLSHCKSEIVNYIKENFGYFTSPIRSKDDDAIERSMEHVIRESKQIAAWVLMQIATGTKKTSWGIHYKFPLFNFDDFVGKAMTELGLSGENIVHIHDPQFETTDPDKIEKAKFYASFLTSQKKFLNGSRKPILKFDPNGLIFIPACYGFPAKITETPLENTIHNYLKIFELQQKQERNDEEKESALGAHNLMMYLGHFDGVDVPKEQTAVEGKKRLESWLKVNKSFLDANNIKIMQFTDLENSPFFAMASNIIDNFLFKDTQAASVALLKSVEGYLTKIALDKATDLVFHPTTKIHTQPLLNQAASKGLSKKKRNLNKEDLPISVATTSASQPIPIKVVKQKKSPPLAPSPSPSTSNSSDSSGAESNSPTRSDSGFDDRRSARFRELDSPTNSPELSPKKPNASIMKTVELTSPPGSPALLSTSPEKPSGSVVAYVQQVSPPGSPDAVGVRPRPSATYVANLLIELGKNVENPVEFYLSGVERIANYPQQEPVRIYTSGNRYGSFAPASRNASIAPLQSGNDEVHSPLVVGTSQSQQAQKISPKK